MKTSKCWPKCGALLLVNALFTFAQSPVITEYPIPTPTSVPIGVAAGPDGNVWFTESNRYVEQVGRITPAGLVTEFHMNSNVMPQLITSGADGNLWFTVVLGPFVGKISPTGVVSVLPQLPSSPGGTLGIALGPDGNIWAVEGTTSKVARITPAGVVTEFPIPSGANGLAAGPDGRLWFTETNGSSNKIGAITTIGIVTEYSQPLPNPLYITAGSDGNLWYTTLSSGVGRMTPSGTVTTFSTSGALGGITSVPGGPLWFVKTDLSLISRITTAGVISDFPTPTNGGPTDIAFGPDGNLWFTEQYANQIGKVTLATSVPTTPAPSSFALLAIGLVSIAAWNLLARRLRRA